jgi:hypothetical protein
VKKIYNNVSIGDVGYFHEGMFIRMFNVMRPWDDESNQYLGELDHYEPLDPGPLTNSLRVSFGKVDHYSSSVCGEVNANSALADSPES